MCVYNRKKTLCTRKRTEENQLPLAKAIHTHMYGEHSLCVGILHNSYLHTVNSLKRRRVVTKTVQHYHTLFRYGRKRERNINGYKRKKNRTQNIRCALSMVHGHNERLVSVSFVFVKDGSAVLVDR